MVPSTGQPDRPAGGAPPPIEMIPAVDIRGGRCVGFVRESLSTERVYASDPAAVAARWEAEGAAWLHVVDMEAAIAGTPVDWTTLRSVVRAVRIPVQIGGRLRRAEDARRALGLGARRVVMGPLPEAASAEVALAEVCSVATERGDAVVLALDVREARQDVGRWAELEALAETASARGVSWVVLADASRDGTLEGPNLEAVDRLKAPGRLRLMLSGGIGSAADLAQLRGLERVGLACVIIGRALYDGHLTFRAAQATLRAG